MRKTYYIKSTIYKMMQQRQSYYITDRVSTGINAVGIPGALHVALVMFSIFLLLGCATGGEVAATDETEAPQVEIAEETAAGQEQQPEADADTVATAAEQAAQRARDEEMQRLIRQMETELFDRYYEKYAGLYNNMISEYMTAQAHLQDGDLERAKTSAVRAATIVPSVLTYELVMVVMSLLEDEAGLEEWRGRLQELREVKESGGFINAEGEIILPD